MSSGVEVLQVADGRFLRSIDVDILLHLGDLDGTSERAVLSVGILLPSAHVIRKRTTLLVP
jgi:hypothetical protein